MKFKPGNPSSPKWVNIESGKIYRMPTEKEAFKPQLIAFLVFMFGCIGFSMFVFTASEKTLEAVSMVIAPPAMVFFLVVMPIMVAVKSKGGRTQRPPDKGGRGL